MSKLCVEENKSLLGFAHRFQEDFYILQTTSTEVQLTGYILKAADKKRWNMGWGRSMV